MTEAQRAQFLVDHCAHGSSSEFAQRIGIDKTRMSRIVHGTLRLNKLFDIILIEYPQVNGQWLRTGKGYPGDLSPELVKQRYEQLLADKDKIIDTLTRIINERL